MQEKNIPVATHTTGASTPRSTALFVDLIVLLCAALAVIGYLHYSFVQYPVSDFNSDDAANLLFANEVLQQGRVLPHWYSSTGIMWPLLPPGSLFLPLLLALGQDWLTTYRVAVACDQAILFLLVWWVLARAGFSRTSRLFLLCTFIATPSSWFAGQTVMIGGKNWLYAYLLLATLSLVRLFDSPHPWKTSPVRWSLPLLALIFVDPSNISMLALPLVGALAVEWVLGGAALSGAGFAAARRAWAGLASAVIAGQIIYLLLRPFLQYTPVTPHFVAFEQVSENARLLIAGLLDLAGAMPSPAAPIYSLSTLGYVSKLLILLVALSMPACLCFQLRSIHDRFLRMLIVAASISLGIKLYIYLFTSIPGGSILTSRYFIVEIMLGLTIAIRNFERINHAARPFVWAMAAMAIVLVISSPYRGTGRPALSAEGLAHRLAEAGLQKGYATFWHALAPTAASGNTVVVRQIGFDRGSIAPMPWLASPDWFRGDPNASSSFLLLAPDEAKTDLTALSLAVGPPQREVQFEGYRALVYSFDLADHLGWGVVVDHPLTGTDFHVDVSAVGEPSWVRNELVLHLHVHNAGTATLASKGKRPVNLGLHLLSADGRMLNHDLAHQAIPPIRPGQSIEFETRFALDPLLAGTRIQADLVQEGVAWFADRGGKPAEIPVPVTGNIRIPDQTTANDDPINSTHTPAHRANQPDPPLPRKAGSDHR